MRCLALGLMLWPMQVLALCTAGVVPVAFGVYNPLSGQNLDSAGSIDVVCLPSAPYTILLSPGQGTYAAREMANGANHLPYNLYTNVSRSLVWGDGTGGSALVSGSAPSASFPVYGRIPAGQNVAVGTYSDTVLVTVSF